MQYKTENYNRNYLTALFFLFIFQGIGAFAYAQKPLRVEIEAKGNTDAYRIIPYGEKGVLLFYEEMKTKNQEEKKWFFSFYDKNLRNTWEKSIELPKKWLLNGFNSDDDFAYILFSSRYKAQQTPIMLLKLNIKDGDSKIYQQKLSFKGLIRDFFVSKNVLFIGGETQPTNFKEITQACYSFTLIPAITGSTILKKEPLIYIWDLNEEKGSIITTDYRKNAFVQDIQEDVDENKINYIIRSKPNRKSSNIHILTYSREGIQISRLTLDNQEKNKRLNNTKLYHVNNDTSIAIGTYYVEPKGKLFHSQELSQNYASGIYFSKIVNRQQTIIKYYNFSKFTQLIYSFNKRVSKRMLKKAERMQERGEEISFDYQLLFHDIIAYKGQNIVIAEAYYPQYRTVYYTYYDMYGRPIVSTYTVFEGYRYTDAIVAAFNNNGNLLWNNTFRIKNILTHYLKERIKVLFDGEEIILVYSSEGKIASKVIKGNEVVEGTEYTAIETSYKNDKVLDDYNSDIVFWYDKYFISYGYQRIQNKVQMQGKQKKREVFYFNKIAFQ